MCVYDHIIVIPQNVFNVVSVVSDNVRKSGIYCITFETLLSSPNMNNNYIQPSKIVQMV